MSLHFIVSIPPSVFVFSDIKETRSAFPKAHKFGKALSHRDPLTLRPYLGGLLMRGVPRPILDTFISVKIGGKWQDRGKRSTRDGEKDFVCSECNFKHYG